jgi:drug/metabolite transporter (DMT)-like permease
MSSETVTIARMVPRAALLWSAFIFLDTATQLAFKWGSQSLTGMEFGGAMLATALATPGVWLAAAGYAGTFVVWMLILSRMPLSRAFPGTSLTYVTVPLFAWTMFGEEIGLVRALGIVSIMLGVATLGWD